MLWLILLAVLLSAMLGSYSYTILTGLQAEAQFPLSGKLVPTEQGSLHYVSLGSGQPVVLLHGNPGFLHDYSAPLLEQLSQNHRVYQIDRPGHGYSDRTFTRSTPLLQLAQLRESLQTLKVEKPILVGQSWSAVMVLAYALYYPDELAGIVLLAPLSHTFSDVPLPPTWLAQSPALETLLKLVPAAWVAPYLIQRSLRAAFGENEIAPEYLKRAQALWSRPSQIAATLQDSSTIQPLLDQLSSRYGEIRVPSAIAVDPVDPFLDATANALALHRAIPHSKLFPLPKAGHALSQTQPQAIVDIILAFTEVSEIPSSLPDLKLP